MIKNQTILVIANEYNRYPSACEHIVNVLSRQNNVVWAESVGLRNPRLSWTDLKRIFGLLKKFLIKKSKKVSEAAKTQDSHYAFHVVSILPVPFVSLKWVRKLNARRLIHAIQTTLERHKLVQPILLTTSPLAGSIVHHVGERLSIYYCMDEFSLWPGIDTHLIRSEEQSLINSVDAVIVTAQTLQQTKVPPSGFIQTITHGVHASHFSLSTATSREVALSDFIKVAYFGLIDERLDQKLLCDVLNRNSNIKLCMIGPVKTDVDELKQHERVEFKGFVAYSSLPSVISDIDVFVLPYKVDALSDFINPLKLKEYLATGRPVVATPISEVCKLASYLSVAGSAELFEKEIVTAARSPNKSKIDAAKALAYSESWETKAEELSAFIQRLERKC